MPDHKEVYLSKAKAYEEMVSRQPDLSKIISSIRPWGGLDVLDLGAGSGRLSTVIAPSAKSLICTDASASMLALLDEKLLRMSIPRNWRSIVADHRELPIPDASMDLIVSGWSICYITNSTVPDAQGQLENVMSELGRVLRPGGTIIIFETMGTGTETPSPPGFLINYYTRLQDIYGFKHRWIRMDYSFDSVEEAVKHTSFFFEPDLADKIRTNQWATLPECAGIWWKHLAEGGENE